MNYKIGVLGETESVFPFQMLGFPVFSPQGEESLREQIRQLVNDHYGILFITEQYAETIPDVLRHYDKEMLPAFIPIPGVDGAIGIGQKRITAMVERAIGQNIL